MTVLDGITIYDKMSLGIFIALAIMTLPSILIRAHSIWASILLISQVSGVAYILPTLVFGLTAFGFKAIAYVLLFTLPIIPIAYAWVPRKVERGEKAR